MDILNPSKHRALRLGVPVAATINQINQGMEVSWLRTTSSLEHVQGILSLRLSLAGDCGDSQPIARTTGMIIHGTVLVKGVSHGNSTMVEEGPTMLEPWFITDNPILIFDRSWFLISFPGCKHPFTTTGTSTSKPLNSQQPHCWSPIRMGVSKNQWNHLIFVLCFVIIFPLSIWNTCHQWIIIYDHIPRSITVYSFTTILSPLVTYLSSSLIPIHSHHFQVTSHSFPSCSHHLGVFCKWMYPQMDAEKGTPSFNKIYDSGIPPIYIHWWEAPPWFPWWEQASSHHVPIIFRSLPIIFSISKIQKGPSSRPRPEGCPSAGPRSGASVCLSAEQPTGSILSILQFFFRNNHGTFPR